MIADQHGELRRHGQRVHAQLDALGVRHLHGGKIDRRRDGEGGRRYLVFHHAQLRVRRGDAARHDAIVEAAGGKVVGSQVYPFPETTDFSAFLVKAQASGAKILGICGAGADLINIVKQAHEFGLTRTMKLARWWPTPPTSARSGSRWRPGRG